VTTVLRGADVEAGLLRRARAAATFTYTEAYLALPGAYALAPALGLHAGPQSIGSPHPLGDYAPDTWGRKILTRAAGRRLDEMSLLLGVNDLSRQGAVRFWVDGAPVADGDGVPAEAELASLLRVADQVDRGAPDVPERDLRRLFRATGSLGGARPKANISIGAELWLAKFPRPVGDPWNVLAWEAAMLDQMGRLGIDCPPHQTRTLHLDGERRTILLLRRFDRTETGGRIPYISALTALEAHDGDGGDWLDLAEWTALQGGDTAHLWKRAAFGALVGNTDDHLRNHGFLRRGPSWTPSPVFDVNPTPLEEGDGHQLTLFGHPEVTLEALLAADALALFRLRRDDAVAWLAEVARALPRSPERARAHGADKASVEIMHPRMERAAELAAKAAAG